jgi:sugar phosphate permease
MTYALYYLGRLNLGPALDPLAASLGVSRAAVGALGTAFFWAYAVGQLVNGELGNRYSPRRIVALGLAVIAVVNLLMPTQTLLAVMIGLWAVNGYAQSTGWGPMLRILSERLGPATSQRISVFFSMSYQVGAAFSIAFAAWLVSVGGWQTAFFVPGLILLGVLAAWWFSRVDAPPAATGSGFRWRELVRDVRLLWPVLVGAVFMGFVYTGALLWTPSYFAESGLITGPLAASLAGLLPLLGAAGMLVAGVLVRRGGAPLPVMARFLAVIVACAIMAALTTAWVQMAALLAMTVAMGGSVALLLASIPLAFAAPGRTSSSAALVTAVQNIGGGLAGVAVGAMMDSTGWASVFAVWAGCAAVALGTTLLMRRTRG